MRNDCIIKIDYNHKTYYLYESGFFYEDGRMISKDKIEKYRNVCEDKKRELLEKAVRKVVG